MTNELTIIAAASINNVIGNNNKLIWHIPKDLIRFKELTLNHSVIMGRKTFDSIGKPLPGRANIILTNKRNLKDDIHLEKYFVQNFEDAVIKANDWIIKKFKFDLFKQILFFKFGQFKLDIL